MYCILGLLNPASAPVRSTAREQRRNLRLIPLVESLEAKTLLSLVYQQSSISASFNVGSTVLEYHNSITQEDAEISPITDSSSNGATDPTTGLTISYSASVSSHVLSDDSGNVTISGNFSSSGSPSFPPWTSYDVAVSYKIRGFASTSGIFTFDYELPSSLSQNSVVLQALFPYLYGGIPITPGVHTYRIRQGDEYNFNLQLDGSHTNLFSTDPASAELSSTISWRIDSGVPPRQTPTIAISTIGPNPLIYGTSLSLTAAVSASASSSPTPTGFVTFMDGMTALNPGGTPLDASGIATFTTATLPIGDHSITAVYSGDSNFSGSTSDLITQTVNPPTPVTASVVPTSLKRALGPAPEPGIDFTYSVAGNLTEDSVIEFYWANGPNYEDRSGPSPAYTYAVNTADSKTSGAHGPIYIPDSSLVIAPKGATYLLIDTDLNHAHSTLFLKRTIDLEVFYALYDAAHFTTAFVPKGKRQIERNDVITKDAPLTSKQKAALKELLKFFEDDATIDLSRDVRFPAYMLATIKRETGSVYIPNQELGKRSYFKKYDPPTKKSKELGNTKKGDGYKYRGRGYVHVTGRRNYTNLSYIFKVNDVDNPDLEMSNHFLAYNSMVYGMRNGIFTTRKIGSYITPDATDYEGARAVINGRDRAKLIAGYADKFAAILENSFLP